MSSPLIRVQSENADLRTEVARLKVALNDAHALWLKVCEDRDGQRERGDIYRAQAEKAGWHAEQAEGRLGGLVEAVKNVRAILRTSPTPKGESLRVIEDALAAAQPKK